MDHMDRSVYNVYVVRNVRYNENDRPFRKAMGRQDSCVAGNGKAMEGDGADGGLDAITPSSNRGLAQDQQSQTLSQRPHPRSTVMCCFNQILIFALPEEADLFDP